jgi:ATP-dependent DNA helicase RecQ
VPAVDELAIKKKRKPKAAVEPVMRSPETPEERLAERPADRPAARPPERAAPPRAENRELVDFFKDWRRVTAQRAEVPAYIVLSDASLEDLCRKQPTNLRELLAVNGFGERKAELYGSEIFAAFEAFRKGARAAVREVAQVTPADETIRLLAEGKTFEQIADIRARQVSTVVHMVADLVEKGRVEYRMEWVGGEENHRRIEEVVRRVGPQWMKPLRAALPEDVTYDEIRLVVAYVRKET